MILATAIVEELVLISTDERMRKEELQCQGELLKDGRMEE